MRASRSGIVRAVCGVVLGGLLLGGPSDQARAEAPFFYDDLYDVAFYDPDLTPMNRPVGYLAGYIQWWSTPDPGHPKQTLTDQDHTDQYRLKWVTPLKQASSAIMLELKGAGEKNIVPEDYFLRAEWIYRGLESPMFIYAGLRAPREGDPIIYAGLESMSFLPSDLFKKVEKRIPIAFKGYGEVRYDTDADNPTLRLMILAHSLRDTPLGKRVAIAAPFEAQFNEDRRPLWLFSPHLDVNLIDGLFRLDFVSGYELELHENGGHRWSLGLRGAFGPTAP